MAHQFLHSYFISRIVAVTAQSWFTFVPEHGTKFPFQWWGLPLRRRLWFCFDCGGHDKLRRLDTGPLRTFGTQRTFGTLAALITLISSSTVGPPMWSDTPTVSTTFKVTEFVERHAEDNAVEGVHLESTVKTWLITPKTQNTERFFSIRFF